MISWVPPETYWPEVTELSTAALAPGRLTRSGSVLWGTKGRTARWGSPNAQAVTLAECRARGLARLAVAPPYGELDLLDPIKTSGDDNVWMGTYLRFYPGLNMLRVHRGALRNVGEPLAANEILRRATSERYDDMPGLSRPTEYHYELLMEELARGAEGEYRY